MREKIRESRSIRSTNSKREKYSRSQEVPEVNKPWGRKNSPDVQEYNK